MTAFIALSGKKQVGKDTATQVMRAILEANGKRVAVTAFAESLKSMCIDILGLKRELVYGTNDDKDTPCHILWDRFSIDVRLKYSNERFEDEDGPPIDLPRNGPMTVREVLQVMGTDIFRAIEDDVWARAPFNKDWSNYDVVFLTDCRFPNEGVAIEDHHGVIIRLERETGLHDNHYSETALDGATFDPRFTYENNSTLEELEKFLLQALKNIGLMSNE